MTLAALLGELTEPGLVRAMTGGEDGALEREVAQIAHDSRAEMSGAVFVALRGQHADGTAFAEQAQEHGAIAVIAETPPPAHARSVWIQVSDARLALALLAAAFQGHPSRDMAVVGITGTNGKTTTAYLVAAIFEGAGIKAGLLGTVAYRIGDEELEATRTTPEAPDVQRYLREMVNRGCGACAMEVSSHALSLKRVHGLRFAAGVFTNLTREHLDFHVDMEAYFAAKRELFEMLPSDAPAVINLDDPRGADLVQIARRPVTYAISKPADITTGPLSFALDGLRFDVRTPRGTIAVRSPLVGRPNVYNILAAVAAGTALDLPFAAIEQGIAALPGVPGRFQVASAPTDDVTVIVDYAHTDDALRNLLETARPLAGGRLLTVFGCGGDRDRTKRPLMGAVAARLSDVVIVTSDNPRTEDPARIIDEVKRGLAGGSDRIDPRGGSGPECLAVVDRRAAIDRAVEMSQPGDLILIAGKGHEKYQVIGDRVLPFDDVAVAREALQKRLDTIARRMSAVDPVVVTVGEAAAVMNGRVVGGDPDTVPRGFSIDTRTLAAGDLFFAIRGERLDGEQYVPAALAAGASGVVTTSAPPPETAAGRIAIVVADTTRALQALANHVRRLSGTKVVAITGSAGKTTTKEVTAELLGARYRVFRNRGNLNNHIGLPLSLLALRDRPDVAVVELGMNHAGEIRTLTKIAEPEVRVWTNVGDAHLEFFASKDAIADAKAEILEGADPQTLLVANADDPLVMARVRGFPGRVRTFGFDEHADVRATDIREMGLAGMTANVHTPAGPAVVYVPLLGLANLSNVLAGTAVALHFDVPLHDIVGRAAALAPATHRGEVIRLRDGVVIVDDSYNSNPSALARALAVIAAETAHPRKLAVLGEMLELGAAAEALHRDSGRAAAAAGLDWLVTVGGAPARTLGRAAVEAGLAAGAVQHAETSAAAAELTLAAIRPGDVILVKGSRGVRTDVVVDRIREVWS